MSSQLVASVPMLAGGAAPASCSEHCRAQRPFASHFTWQPLSLPQSMPGPYEAGCWVTVRKPFFPKCFCELCSWLATLRLGVDCPRPVQRMPHIGAPIHVQVLLPSYDKSMPFTSVEVPHICLEREGAAAMRPACGCHRGFCRDPGPLPQ